MQRLFARDRAFAAPALAVQLFGQIYHLKIETEGADHVDRIVKAQRVEDRVEFAFLDAGRIGPVTARQRAQALDIFERAGTRVRAQHVADEPPENRDARSQCGAGIAFDAHRFGRPCRRPLAD